MHFLDKMAHFSPPNRGAQFKTCTKNIINYILLHEIFKKNVNNKILSQSLKLFENICSIAKKIAFTLSQ